MSWHKMLAACVVGVGLFVGVTYADVSTSATTPEVAGAEVAATGETPSGDAWDFNGPAAVKINTVDAELAGVGEWQFRLDLDILGSTQHYSNGGSAHSRGSWLDEMGATATISTGIVPNVDGVVSIGFRNADDDVIGFDESGVTDLSVGAKWQFYASPERDFLSMLYGGLTIPIDQGLDNQAVELTQDHVSVDTLLVATKSFAEDWVLTGDLGYSLSVSEKRDNARGTLRADVALGYQVLPWLQPEVEFNHTRNITSSGSAETRYNITAGVIMPIRSDLQLGVGVQQTLAGRNTDRILRGIAFARWTLGD